MLTRLHRSFLFCYVLTLLFFCLPITAGPLDPIRCFIYEVLAEGLFSEEMAPARNSTTHSAQSPEGYRRNFPKKGELILEGIRREYEGSILMRAIISVWRLIPRQNCQ